MILGYIDYRSGYAIKDYASSTFSYNLVVWYEVGAMFLFGIYLSFLFIKRWSLQVNFPLLFCVCIPCLLLSVIVPFELSNLFSMWKIMSNGIISLVAGFTLPLGLFSVNERSER
ncbi:hypothetical protein [Brevibacillus reuszeri]|uniref:hypothetical protein n=1 Tax=Brevibacillus reuszeri TaxID=54915 RepID=UPI00289AA2DA|nr:hypothetical protein [Brevibacillus reuszeri]